MDWPQDKKSYEELYLNTIRFLTGMLSGATSVANIGIFFYSNQELRALLERF